ncbi:sodium-coupled neutral amino acid [Nannochloropsis oceanica]
MSWQHIVHIPLPLPRQIQELQGQEEEGEEEVDSASDFEDALEEEREEEDEDDEGNEEGNRAGCLISPTVPSSRGRFLDGCIGSNLRGRGRGGRGGGMGRGFPLTSSSGNSSVVPPPLFSHQGNSTHLVTTKGRGVSFEMLEPDFHDLSRKSSLSVAVVNVIATVVGGGTLSIPYAFMQCGWALGTFLLLTACLSCNFALYILVSCSRRTGKRSYQAIARHCFGPKVEMAILGLLILFLFLVLMAFMLLVRDTATDLVEFLTGARLSAIHSHYILAATLWLVFPLCLCRSLHALRHSCYLQLASVLLLTFFVIARSLQVNPSSSPSSPSFSPSRLSSLRAFPLHWTDALTAWPIFVLANMCTFNILPVHASLVDPTRARLKKVIGTSAACTFLLYLALGLSGYMYALEETKDDILNNFPSSDGLIFLGRLGLGATLFFSLPILLLPMREVTIELLGKLYRWTQGKKRRSANSSNSSSNSSTSNQIGGGSGGREGGKAGGTPRPVVVAVGNESGEKEGGRKEEEEGERQPLLNNGQDRKDPRQTDGQPLFSVPSSQPPSLLPSFPAMDDYELSSASIERAEALQALRHFLVTLFLLIGGYRAAMSAPGISFIWSLCGSSMGFLLCLTLPCAFYLKIRHRKQHVLNKTSCHMVLVGSTLSILLCTSATLHSLYLASRSE